MTPEEYATELVAEAVEIDIHNLTPGLIVSEEELRASIAEQMRQLDSGEAVLYTHEEVMASARAILAKGRDSA